MRKVLVIAASLIFVGCGSSSLQSQRGREVIDNSVRGGAMPEWTTSPKVSWEEGDKVVFRSSYTVQGNQRVNGCYDLARMELSEKVLSEIENEIKGELSLASEGISEGADPLITKSLQSKLAGKIRGMNQKEQAFERYVVLGTERIDCHVLGMMTKQDYLKLKQSTLNQLISVNEKVAEAVRNRQTEFFSSDNKDQRAPAGKRPAELPVKQVTEQ